MPAERFEFVFSSIEVFLIHGSGDRSAVTGSKQYFSPPKDKRIAFSPQGGKEVSGAVKEASHNEGEEDLHIDQTLSLCLYLGFNILPRFDPSTANLSPAFILLPAVSLGDSCWNCVGTPI